MTCPHTRLTFVIKHNAFEDTNVRVVELKANCEACGEAMRFLGAPIGSSLTRPTVAADSLTANVPIVALHETPNSALDVVITPAPPEGPAH